MQWKSAYFHFLRWQIESRLRMEVESAWTSSSILFTANARLASSKTPSAWA